MNSKNKTKISVVMAMLLGLVAFSMPVQVEAQTAQTEQVNDMLSAMQSAIFSIPVLGDLLQYYEYSSSTYISLMIHYLLDTFSYCISCIPLLSCFVAIAFSAPHYFFTDYRIIRTLSSENINNFVNIKYAKNTLAGDILNLYNILIDNILMPIAFYVIAVAFALYSLGSMIPIINMIGSLLAIIAVPIAIFLLTIVYLLQYVLILILATGEVCI